MKYIIPQERLKILILEYIKTFYGELEPVVNDKKTEVHFVDSNGVSRMSGHEGGRLYVSYEFYKSCASMFGIDLENISSIKLFDKFIFQFIKDEFGLIFNKLLFYFEGQ
jgi:hypothetical protein